MSRAHDEFEDEPLLTEECERSWRQYLQYFRTDVYPMFEEQHVSFDAALTCWFVNRLRNAIDDRDAGNDLEL